jgi:tetratricopeptide (TPR) repeat protein
LLFFLLGPGLGSVLAGVWGALCGLVVRASERRWRRALLAALAGLGGPLFCVAFSLWRFWSSPMVFAFDPFFGWFSGTLYDTVLEGVPRLATYRIGTLQTLLAAALLAPALRRDAGTPLGLRLGLREKPWWVAGGAAAALGSLAHSLSGPALGHWQSAASIRDALGQTIAGQRCDVVGARDLERRDLELVQLECETHLAGIERWLGAAGPPRVTVYVFASAAEKGRLMGASDTYIAKPWRAEVYLQAAPYPHPVLGHELAHVVAGPIAGGAFGVPGRLAGLVPDPGRIEGLAVAAAPDEDEDLTAAEWAKAMLDLGILPPLRRVFGLGFLGDNAPRSYTVAGAFVGWLHARGGAKLVRDWYAGGDLAVLAEKPLDELEAEWRRSLAAVRVAPEAMQVARARFDRPGVFGRRCPHVVDRLARQAGARLSGADVAGAREAFERVLALDPAHAGARLGLGGCARRQGGEDGVAEARRRFEAVASDTTATRVVRAGAAEALGDLELALGRVEPAARRYEAAASAVVDEDHRRTLEVKLLAARSPHGRALASLLVGDLRLGPDPVAAAAELGRWATLAPDDGLPEYLVGRNLWGRGRLREAARYLDAALARKLEPPSVRREALRVRWIVACAERRVAEGKPAYRRWLDEPGLSAARRQAGERIAGRCGLAPVDQARLR